MEYDDSGLAKRIQTHYAHFRAAGWSRGETCEWIAADLAEMALCGWGTPETRATASGLASPERVQVIVDASPRQPCPNELEAELFEHIRTLYARADDEPVLASRLAWKYFNSPFFPLFDEKLYERLEEERTRRR